MWWTPDVQGAEAALFRDAPGTVVDMVRGDDEGDQHGKENGREGKHQVPSGPIAPHLPTM
jgi:hypothetical protein